MADFSRTNLQDNKASRNASGKGGGLMALRKTRSHQERMGKDQDKPRGVMGAWKRKERPGDLRELVPFRDYGITRVMIDKVDLDSKIVRCEIVPISKRRKRGFDITGNLKAKEGQTWWISSRADSIYVRLPVLRDFLSLKSDSELNENMVFWVHAYADKKTKKESLDVYHATHAARKLGEDLYSSLMNTKASARQSRKKSTPTKE
jgi:hypothetical protein